MGGNMGRTWGQPPTPTPLASLFSVSEPLSQEVRTLFLLFFSYFCFLTSVLQNWGVFSPGYILSMPDGNTAFAEMKLYKSLALIKVINYEWQMQTIFPITKWRYTWWPRKNATLTINDSRIRGDRISKLRMSIIAYRILFPTIWHQDH